MTRDVVYTAVFGGYDHVPVPRAWRSLVGTVDFLCFCDPVTPCPRGWTRIEVDPADEAPSLANRRIKVLGHPRLEAYDRSLYVDGNIGLRRDPRPFLDRALARHPLAVPAHPLRDCVYEEALACIAMGKGDRGEIEEHVALLRARGMPAHDGLTENSIIARDLRSVSLRAFLSAWWARIAAGPARDQLHLQPLAREHAFEIETLPRTELHQWRLFRRLPHHERGRPMRNSVARTLAATFDLPVGRVLEVAYAWQRRGRRLPP